MNKQAKEHMPAVPAAEVPETVLVVDDSRLQRRILAAYLHRWGYNVREADSGEQALAILKDEPVDIVVSDWMMPGMSGLELCREFRALGRASYGYFVLLTSMSEKAEVAEGLDVGADDFLTKPVSAAEFLARIRAGQRILRMERELSEKNRLLNQTLGEISALYESLDRDLVEARRLQQSLVRERHHDFGAAAVSLLLRPSGHVGGDLVGFFPVDRKRFGIFAVDVSGHGVASALLTARLAGHLSGRSPGQNLALRPGRNGKVEPRLPSEVARDLNAMFLEDDRAEHYFTMILGTFDSETGTLIFCQCGHPHPVIQRAGGAIVPVGAGGLPVGLIAAAEWQDQTVTVAPGDRLLILSDGVTECRGPDGAMLGDDGLERLVHRNARLRGQAFFETLMWDIASFADDGGLDDDVSGILLEYRGAGEAR